jgi:hypothetical protein
MFVTEQFVASATTAGNIKSAMGVIATFVTLVLW